MFQNLLSLLTVSINNTHCDLNTTALFLVQKDFCEAIAS